MGFFFSLFLNVPMVLRYGAQTSLNTKRAMFSKNISFFQKLSYFLMYIFTFFGERFLFSRCKKIVVNSKAIIPKFLKKKQVNVIYNGVDIDYFKVKGSLMIRKKIGLKDNLITVGMHGAINETKGIYYLVEAMKSFEGRVNFLLIGDGDLLEYCKDKIPWGVYPGFVNKKNILEYINCLDVVIFPPLKEGNDSFPNSLLESMSCEKVVIASKMGGIPEMIEDGKDGYLIDANSSSAIKEALKKVLALSLDDKKLITDRAREKVKKKFNLEVQMNKLTDYFFGCKLFR